MIKQSTISIPTLGRSTYNITRHVNELVSESQIKTGICHVFIQHTSASLIISENADPDVHRDLEYFMQKTVADGDPSYFHKDEGPDDMSAHIRSVITQTQISIPITSGQLALGTWQGLYCWEHRTHGHQRNISITLQS